jgi:hypothetical protein
MCVCVQRHVLPSSAPDHTALILFSSRSDSMMMESIRRLSSYITHLLPYRHSVIIFISDMTGLCPALVMFVGQFHHS